MEVFKNARLLDTQRGRRHGNNRRSKLVLHRVWLLLPRPGRDLPPSGRESHGDSIPGLLTTITPEVLEGWDRSQIKGWLGRTHCERCGQILDIFGGAVGHFEDPGMECYLFDPSCPPAELPPEAEEPLIEVLGIRVMGIIYLPEQGTP